jgi:hypothetical protein
MLPSFVVLQRLKKNKSHFSVKPFWQQGDFIQVKTQCFTVSNIWNTYYLRYCFSNWFVANCISKVFQRWTICLRHFCGHEICPCLRHFCGHEICPCFTLFLCLWDLSTFLFFVHLYFFHSWKSSQLFSVKSLASTLGHILVSIPNHY